MLPVPNLWTDLVLGRQLLLHLCLFSESKGRNVIVYYESIKRMCHPNQSNFFVFFLTFFLLLSVHKGSMAPMARRHLRPVVGLLGVGLVAVLAVMTLVSDGAFRFCLQYYLRP